MTAQKCKKILLHAALKDFWSSANLKLKKINLSKNSHFFRIILKKMQEWGFLGVTFVCRQFRILLHSDFSEKSFTLKVCKPMKDMKAIWWCQNLIIFLDILLQWLAFLWTGNDWIVWSVAHNLTKFLVYKSSQFDRFTEFRCSLHVVKNMYNGSLTWNYFISVTF